MASHEATTAWPTNLGAYLRALPALPFTGSLLAAAATTWSPSMAGAAIASLAGDLGVLFAGEHPVGWRRHAKAAFTWAGTLVATVLLAVGSYEGAEALSVGTLLQLDAHDWLAIAVVVAKSVLQTALKNTPPRFADVADDVRAVVDLVEPTTADTSGRPVTAATSGLTGTLPQLVMVDGRAVIPTQNTSLDEAMAEMEAQA